MYIPLSREIDDAFRHQDLRVKLFGGSFVGVLLGLSAIRQIPNASLVTYIGGTIVVTLVSLLVVLALTLRDVVRTRRENKEPVSAVLIVLVGWGLVSLMIWLIFLFTVALISFWILYEGRI